jgi:hypothetical protein
MLRTRSLVLSAATFLLLSAGALQASKNPVLTSPRPTFHAHAASAATGRAGAHASPVARVLRGRERDVLGLGGCPTGIEIELWPPNHKKVDIDLAQVLGPNTQDIEILSITQDEPVDERGDGNTECDGDGVGTSVAHIRSERSGRGNGRVYEIEYSAFQGACGGFVHVVVPHDQSGRPAEDDGQDFDSTEGCE